MSELSDREELLRSLCLEVASEQWQIDGDEVNQNSEPFLMMLLVANRAHGVGYAAAMDASSKALSECFKRITDQ